jgi:hypothetical protein
MRNRVVVPAATHLHEAWLDLESGRLAHAHARATLALDAAGGVTRTYVGSPALAGAVRQRPRATAPHTPPEPDSGAISDALVTLATVALRCGRPDVATPMLCEAMWRSPDKVLAHVRHKEATQAPPVHMPHGRFLVIKALGEGFFAEVFQVLAGLLLAQSTNRTPVIDWGEGFLFARDEEAALRSRVEAGASFTDLFEPIPGVASLEELTEELDGPRQVVDAGVAGPGGDAGVAATRGEAGPDGSGRAGIAEVWPPRWDASRGGRSLASARDPRARAPVHEAWIGAYAARPERTLVLDFPIGVGEALAWLPASHPLHGAGLWDALTQLRRAFLVPRAELEAEADAFVAREFGGEPFIAAHVRLGDMWRMHPRLSDDVASMPLVLASLRDACARSRVGLSGHGGAVADEVEGKDAANAGGVRDVRSADGARQPRIFLMTDSERARELFVARYKDDVACQDCTRTRTREALHRMRWPARARLAREVLLDVLIASRAHSFAGTACSHVTGATAWWRRWEPGHLALIGPNVQATRVPAWFGITGRGAGVAQSSTDEPNGQPIGEPVGERMGDGASERGHASRPAHGAQVLSATSAASAASATLAKSGTGDSIEPPVVQVVARGQGAKPVG